MMALLVFRVISAAIFKLLASIHRQQYMADGEMVDIFSDLKSLVYLVFS